MFKQTFRSKHFTFKQQHLLCMHVCVDRMVYSLLGNVSERAPSTLRQIGEITTIKPHSQRSVAKVIQGQSNSTEVWHSTPVNCT